MGKHGIDDGLLYDEKLLESIVSLYQEAIRKYLEVTDDNMICCVFEKNGLEDKNLIGVVESIFFFLILL